MEMSIEKEKYYCSKLHKNVIIQITVLPHTESTSKNNNIGRAASNCFNANECGVKEASKYHWDKCVHPELKELVN